MTTTYKSIESKIRLSGMLTGREKMTILTLLERFYTPARWEIMTEGYIVCSHCHNEPKSREPSPYCPTCGAMMKQPDWYRPEKENPHEN